MRKIRLMLSLWTVAYFIGCFIWMIYSITIRWVLWNVAPKTCDWLDIQWEVVMWGIINKRDKWRDLNDDLSQ